MNEIWANDPSQLAELQAAEARGDVEIHRVDIAIKEGELFAIIECVLSARAASFMNGWDIVPVPFAWPSGVSTHEAKILRREGLRREQRYGHQH